MLLDAKWGIGLGSCTGLYSQTGKVKQKIDLCYAIASSATNTNHHRILGSFAKYNTCNNITCNNFSDVSVGQHQHQQASFNACLPFSLNDPYVALDPTEPLQQHLYWDKPPSLVFFLFQFALLCLYEC